jgi:nucleotidyltransferase/DNA polymerase involved in DNA repair
MELTHIKGIGKAKATKLADAGITDIHTLAKADVDKVAKQSGIAAATIRSWQEAAVGLTLIEDLRGVGPGTVKTLAEAGVSSLKDLFEASTEWLAAQAKVAEGRARQWQEEARKTYDRIRVEAQTTAGRQRLVAEGKDLATKAAKRTKQTAEQLLATAQKEGEAAIAKAKELRQSAPIVLQDYRLKAEKALKDAEAQVVSLRAKTPDALKAYTAKAEAAARDAQTKVVELRTKVEEFSRAELQKAKAANEGFLRKLRTRRGQ